MRQTSNHKIPMHFLLWLLFFYLIISISINYLFLSFFNMFYFIIWINLIQHFMVQNFYRVLPQSVRSQLHLADFNSITKSSPNKGFIFNLNIFKLVKIVRNSGFSICHYITFLITLNTPVPNSIAMI